MILARSVSSLIHGLMLRWLISSHQDMSPNYGNETESIYGVPFGRPNITNDEAMDPDYVQQSLVPLDDETHSGAGEHCVLY